MDSLYLLLLSLPVAGLITWRLLTGSKHERRHERQAASSLTAKPLRVVEKVALPRSRYAAVSLRICNNPCGAAVAAQGKSVLVGESAVLPLEGCDRRCHCTYAHHEDRRIAVDRRYPASDVIELSGPAALKDSRAGRDRRRIRTPEPYQGIY
jgi:hypothetical protein